MAAYGAYSGHTPFAFSRCAPESQLGGGQFSAESVVGGLEKYVAILGDRHKSNAERAEALKFVVHFVGDVHQPLHVSPVGTSGGNDIRITWFNEQSNLHRLWDEQLIEYQTLSYSEYVKAINFTTAAQRKTWQQQPLSQWFYDSYVLSEQLHDEIRDQNPKLSYRYNFDHLAVLNAQLLKGGVHLAGLLNEIFG